MSFLALAQPSLSGERGLILSGCVWFLWWSIDPLATYLRRRAPSCLFWRREGSPCEVASTICTVHQSNIGRKLKQANGAKSSAAHICLDVGLCVCPLQRSHVHVCRYKKYYYETVHLPWCGGPVSWAAEGFIKSMGHTGRWDCPCHFLLGIYKELGALSPRQACQHSHHLDARVSQPVHCQGQP